MAAAMALAGGACTAEDAPGKPHLGPGEVASIMPPGPPSSEAAPRASTLRERPPASPPLPEGWHTVVVGAIASVDVPGDVVDTTPVRDCGNGPVVRVLEGDRLQVRVEVGHELLYLPLEPADERDTLVRVHARDPWQLGARRATHLRFDEPLLSSRELAPDGSWPSFETIEAVHVDGIEVATPPAAPLGQPTGPLAVAVRIKGGRDAKLVETILRSLIVL